MTKPITQPEDKGIVLKDILEDGLVDRDKSHCLDANYFKGGNLKSYFEKHRRQLVFSKDGLCHVGDADLKGNDSIKRVYHQDGKSPTLTTMGGGHREPKVLVVPEATKKGYTEIQPGDCFDATFPTSKTRRGRNMKDKSNCLTAANYDYMVLDGPYPMQFKAKNKKNVIINESDLDAPKTVYEARTELGKQTRREIKRLTGKDSTKRSPEHKQYQVQKHQKANCLVTVDSELNKVIDKQLVYRKLTPLECERLQTVPDGYTEGVSNTQRYKMLGNGWTVDVICHIFQAIKAQQVRQVA